MTAITPAMSLGEIAALVPEATQVFEDFGIDYCCGGKKSLEQACALSKVSTEDVLRSIQESQFKREGNERTHDWSHESLASLISHIKGTHHKYTRAEIARIIPLLRKVLSAHGTNHPELRRISSEFEALACELQDHLIDEELVVFPYIVRIEECSGAYGLTQPSASNSLRESLATMVFQHDAAGDKLRAIRQASGDYRVPEDACMTYRAAYRTLADFEADLHQHIHLENNILFPRATAIEEKLSCEMGAAPRGADQAVFVDRASCA